MRRGALLTKYNQGEFHLRHACTVEGVMRYFANELGYGDEADFWANVGLLHDVDFEMYPEEHCQEGADDSGGRRLRRAVHPRRGLPRLRPLQRREARARDGKSALRRGRIDRPDQRCGHYAALAPASTISNCPLVKKKFKDKKFRRRLFPRRHPSGRGDARLVSGRPHHPAPFLPCRQCRQCLRPEATANERTRPRPTA